MAALKVAVEEVTRDREGAVVKRDAILDQRNREALAAQYEQYATDVDKVLRNYFDSAQNVVRIPREFHHPLADGAINNIENNIALIKNGIGELNKHLKHAAANLGEKPVALKMQSPAVHETAKPSPVRYGGIRYA